MKRIGILYGNESSFQHDIIHSINSKNIKGINPELVSVGAVKMNDQCQYDVILDRVSHEVPFYRSYLKQCVLNNVAVVNNPYHTCSDDSYFHTVLSDKLGIKVPRTVILPSKAHPIGTNSDTMRNLIYPLNWDDVFGYIGFPAYIKPNVESAVHNIFKIYNPGEFFAAYDLTDSNVMILQENIDFDSYYRCYVIGRKHVKVMAYDPTKPWHLRFRSGNNHIDPLLIGKLEKISLTICKALGFDYNSIEFAVRDGVPYAVDFMNPAPIADPAVLTEENYEWLVTTTADFLVEIAMDKEEYIRRYNMCFKSALTDDKKKIAKLESPAVPETKKRGRPKKSLKKA